MTTPQKGDYRQRALGLEIRAAGDDGTFEGYGSVFGETDSYGDKMAPGCFAESLDAWGQKGKLPKLLYQHRADTIIGKYDAVTEDSRGLHVRGRLFLGRGIAAADSAHALMREGELDGLSIGFAMQDWEWNEEERQLTHTRVDLWEISVVTFPAMPGAEISSVRAAEAAAQWTHLKDAEACLRGHGFSREDATAIVSRISRMGRQGEPVPTPVIDQGEPGAKRGFLDAATRLRALLNT